MASIINKELLEQLGIQIPDEEVEQLSAYFESTLDERIMDEVVEELNDDQLKELSGLKGKSSEELSAWLQANVPDIKDIIQDETTILLGELAENSDKLASEPGEQQTKA